MNTHKIVVRQGKWMNTFTVELLEYRSWFIFGWYKKILSHEVTEPNVQFYVNQWAVEYGLDVEQDVEDLT